MTSSIPWDDLMSAADESSVAPIPASDYNLKIVSCEATTSSSKKPMWKIVAEVEDGPYAGRKIWTQQTLSMENPNAVAMFFKVMATVGLNKAYFATRPSNTEIASAMVGRRFKGKVGIEQWDGEDRNKISKWSPLTAGGLTPPPAGGPAGGPPPPPQPSAAPPAPPAAPMSTPTASAEAAAAPVTPAAAPPAPPQVDAPAAHPAPPAAPVPPPAPAAPEAPAAPPAPPSPGAEATPGAYPTDQPPF